LRTFFFAFFREIIPNSNAKQQSFGIFKQAIKVFIRVENLPGTLVFKSIAMGLIDPILPTFVLQESFLD